MVVTKNIQKYIYGLAQVSPSQMRVGGAGSAGFTIIELLIASSVFSVVLLVALTGFLQIGRVFYKGISDSQTQNVARQVVTDISSSLSNTSSDDGVSTVRTSGGYRYICIGIVRYTWGVYTNNADTSLNGRPTFYDLAQSKQNIETGQLTRNNNPYAANPSLGLVRDTVPGEGSCPVPCISGTTDAACPPTNFLALNTNKTKEMLGDRMRTAALSVTKTSSGLYDVNVVVAYGSNDLIKYENNDISRPYCLGDNSDQRFCAVQQLQTSMLRGGRSI